jgi:hypothetical protein
MRRRPGIESPACVGVPIVADLQGALEVPTFRARAIQIRTLPQMRALPQGPAFPRVRAFPNPARLQDSLPELLDSYNKI